MTAIIGYALRIINAPVRRCVLVGSAILGHKEFAGIAIVKPDTGEGLIKPFGIHFPAHLGGRLVKVYFAREVLVLRYIAAMQAPEIIVDSQKIYWRGNRVEIAGLHVAHVLTVGSHHI